MTSVKVRIYRSGDSEPATTVTIPAGILRIASGFVPKSAMAALKEQGIDLEELVRLTESPETRGTVVEVEDHRKNERVVISLE